jgi:hypothetical protein
MATSHQQELQDPLQQRTLAPEPVDTGLEDPLADALAEPLGDPLSGSLQLSAAGPPPGGSGGGDPSGFHDTAMSGLSGSGGSLPHLDSIQSSFGHHDVTGVSAHTDGAAKSANLQLKANGFALGDHVALGKSDLFTTAHEAAHTVQQQGGVSLKGNMGQAGDAHEVHADAVASKVVSGESAEGLLDQYTGGAPSTVGAGGAGIQMLQRDGEDLDEDDQTALVEDSAHQLGEVDSIRGMQSTVGGLLDVLVPLPGTKKKIEFKVDVACSPVVSVGLKYGSYVERADDGKLKVKTTVEFGAKATADLWVAEAVIQASVGGYVEAMGSSGAQIMDLVGLAIHQSISAVSSAAAGYVFGEDYAEDVRDEMDDDDFIESGITAGVSGGLSAGVGSEDVAVKAEASAGASGKLGVKHTKAGSEVVASGDASAKLKATVSGKLPGSDWAGTGTIVGVAGAGKSPTGEVSFDLSRQANMAQFTDSLQSGQFQEHLLLWLDGAVSLISGAVGSHLSMDTGGERNVGALLADMATVSVGASVAGSGLLSSVQDKLGTTVGAEMKQALNIKLKWSSGTAKLDMDLSRASKLKVAASIKAAKIEVLIENLMRLVKIPTITF